MFHMMFMVPALVLVNIAVANAGNFLVLGDWGGIPVRPYTTTVEESTAKQMSKTAEEKESQFVVALGKNDKSDRIYWYHTTTINTCISLDIYARIFLSFSIRFLQADEMAWKGGYPINTRH